MLGAGAIEFVMKTFLLQVVQFAFFLPEMHFKIVIALV